MVFLIRGKGGYGAGAANFPERLVELIKYYQIFHCIMTALKAATSILTPALQKVW